MRQRCIPRTLFLFTLAGALVASPEVASAQRAPAPQIASPQLPAIVREIRTRAGGKLKGIYASRNFAPFWAQSGAIGREADALISLLNSADLDGLKPKSYKIRDLQHDVEAARRGDVKAIARAELSLSKALSRYAMDLRRLPKRDASGTIYADPRLKPQKPREETALRVAAFAPSFGNYINYMQWMSPHYLRMRTMLWRARAQGEPEAVLNLIRLNLERARSLPGPMTHHIVVDAGSARLWYYQRGRQHGTMRVVVGKAESATPMFVGTLQYAVLNPYWNIPVDLVQHSTAPKVLAGRSLKMMSMEALSDWTANAHVLNPASIDWPAVAAGTLELRLRQLPGPLNAMGKVKFMFPNDLGIYLHDTPERDLLLKEGRHFSNGCIRLEDAAGLGQWLLGRSIRTASRDPEQIAPLPAPVPVYITYFTVTEGDTATVLLNDVYGRDSHTAK